MLVVAGIASYAGLGVVTLFTATTIETGLLVPLGFEAGAGSLTHGVVLAAHVGAWALLAGLAVTTAARLLGATSPIGPWDRALFLVGVLVAALLQLAIHEYGRQRFGFYDPRDIGLTALLPAAMVAQLAAWALVLVSRGTSAVAWLAQVLATLAVLGIVGTNVPGASNGLNAGSLPLAGAIGLAGLVLSGTWVSAWAAARPAYRANAERG
jgi:hypothetical protein